MLPLTLSLPCRCRRFSCCLAAACHLRCRTYDMSSRLCVGPLSAAAIASAITKRVGSHLKRKQWLSPSMVLSMAHSPRFFCSGARTQRRAWAVCSSFAAWARRIRTTSDRTCSSRSMGCQACKKGGSSNDVTGNPRNIPCNRVSLRHRVSHFPWLKS